MFLKRLSALRRPSVHKVVQLTQILVQRHVQNQPRLPQDLHGVLQIHPVSAVGQEVCHTIFEDAAELCGSAASKITSLLETWSPLETTLSRRSRVCSEAMVAASSYLFSENVFIFVLILNRCTYIYHYIYCEWQRAYSPGGWAPFAR